MAVVKRKIDPLTPAERRAAEKRGYAWKGWQVTPRPRLAFGLN